MRTALRLPDELLAAAKRRAAEDGTTLSRVIEDALRAHLASRSPSRSDSVDLPTFRGDGVRPGVDVNGWASVLDAMEPDTSPHRRR
jgi:hypothetical protein